MGSKRYTDEFKADAAKQVVDLGRPIREFALSAADRPQAMLMSGGWGLSASQLNLLGHRKEVDQNITSEGLKLRRIFLTGKDFPVRSFIAINTDLVRPLLQRRGKQVPSRQGIDPLFKTPCLHLRAQILQRDFQRASKEHTRAVGAASLRHNCLPE